MVKETFNAKETFEAGYEMGKKALPGQIYCLKWRFRCRKNSIYAGLCERS